MIARDDDVTGKNTRVIAVGNQKGGVGKSTNTVNLAAALGELGRKCLIIDLDANCGATRSLGVPTTWMGTFELLLGNEPPSEIVIATDAADDIALPKGVDIITGSRQLESIDEVFRQRRENKFKDPADSLKAPLEQLRGLYDYIFLDTAPNAASPTIAAYKSADWFMLSMTPEKLAYEALLDAVTDILAVRSSGNHGLRLLGVVLSQLDRRTRAASMYTERIQKAFQDVGELGAFATTISRAAVIPRSNEAGQSVFQFDPEHKVTEEYRELAREVEQRLVDGKRVQEPEVGEEREAEVSEAIDA
ncbi:MAG: ParA family protein [Dehalococcoidia bacterium]